AALQHLGVAAALPHVHLQSADRVRVRGGTALVVAAGQGGLEDGPHQLEEVGPAHAAARHQPHVHLVRLAGAQPVHDVPAVDDPRSEDQAVAAGGRGAAEGAGDDGRHVGAEDVVAVEVAGVAAVAGGAVGRVVETVVVVGDGDDARAAVDFGGQA